MARYPLLRSIIVSAPLLLAPVAAIAGTDTDTLTVTATVQSACALNGGAMAFGTYLSGQASNLDAVGQIAYVNCNGTLTLELDGGQSGNINDRTMVSGSNQLHYQLYRTSVRNAIWGTGSNAQQVQLLQPLSGNVSVYGRITAGQSVAAGTYTDTVNITLTF
jgi:spore coat protein U-like protein